MVYSIVSLDAVYECVYRDPESIPGNVYSVSFYLILFMAHILVFSGLLMLTIESLLV